MPTVTIDHDSKTLTVDFSPGEQAAALHRDLVIPLSTITWAGPEGGDHARPPMLTPRVGLSGFGRRCGQFFRNKRREFWYVNQDAPALVLEVEDGKYSLVGIQVDDVDATLAEIESLRGRR